MIQAKTPDDHKSEGYLNYFLSLKKLK